MAQKLTRPETGLAAMPGSDRQLAGLSGLRNVRLGSGGAGGLELVHFPVPHTRFVDVNLAIRVGSRHDPRGVEGMTHFLEHMLFRGCRRLSTSFELNREFERIGEGLNALTHKEFTMFTTRVPRHELGYALELLASVIFEPLFNDVETERQIVLEELLEELDEEGKETDIENISRRLVFGSHPLGRPVLGRKPSLKRIKVDDLKRFHAANYIPEKMILSIAGGCSWKEAETAAQNAFGSLQQSAHEQKHEAPQAGVPRLRTGMKFIEEKASQVEVILSFFMPGEQSPGELSRLFLSRVLDDGISSRLQRTVCEHRGLLYDISCGIESMADVSLFDVQFSVSVGKLVEVVEVVVAELQKLKGTLIGSDEFEVVRARFTRDVQMTAESSRAMAPLMAEAFVLQLPFPIDPEEYQARIRELTPSAVQEEARNAFRFANCAVVAKGRVNAKIQRKFRAALRRLG